MTTYRVVWEIDIEAADPKEAAEQAREIQLNPESEATCFDVIRESDQTKFWVDLLEETVELKK